MDALTRGERKRLQPDKHGHIDLSRTMSTAADVSRWVLALREWTPPQSLAWIGLRHNQLDKHDAADILDTVGTNIHYINLAHNNIKSLQPLADFLEKTVTRISFQHNYLTLPDRRRLGKIRRRCEQEETPCRKEDSRMVEIVAATVVIVMVHLQSTMQPAEDSQKAQTMRTCSRRSSPDCAVKICGQKPNTARHGQTKVQKEQEAFSDSLSVAIIWRASQRDPEAHVPKDNCAAKTLVTVSLSLSLCLPRTLSVHWSSCFRGSLPGMS